MTKDYRKAEDPVEGAAILRLTFSARGELDDASFRVIYRGVLEDLGLSDAQVTDYIRKHKARLVERLAELGPDAFSKR